jgi:hypothetical protein
MVRSVGECRGLCGKPHARRIMREPNSPYYAPDFTCECGDVWDMDEGLFTRPFRRGWRQEAQARFTERWEKAAPEGTEVFRDDDGYITGAILPDGTEVPR